MASQGPGLGHVSTLVEKLQPPSEEKVGKEGPIGESQAAWGPQTSEGG